MATITPEWFCSKIHPTPPPSVCRLPTLLWQRRKLSSDWANKAQAFPSSAASPECVAEALLNTHVKGTQLLLLGHLVTVALFPFLLLSNSVCTEKYDQHMIFFLPTTKSSDNTLICVRHSHNLHHALRVPGNVHESCQRRNNKELAWQKTAFTEKRGDLT